MESDLGEKGPQSGQDQPQEEKKEGPEEQGKRRSLEAEVVLEGNRPIVQDGKRDSQHQEEEKNDPTS
jgi:hypothetical protein